VGEINSQQRTGEPFRHPRAVQHDRPIVGQAGALEIDERLVRVLAENARYLFVSAFIEIAHQTALHEAPLFYRRKRGAKNTGHYTDPARVLDSVRPPPLEYTNLRTF